MTARADAGQVSATLEQDRCLAALFQALPAATRQSGRGEKVEPSAAEQATGVATAAIPKRPASGPAGRSPRTSGGRLPARPVPAPSTALRRPVGRLFGERQLASASRLVRAVTPCASIDVGAIGQEIEDRAGVGVGSAVRDAEPRSDLLRERAGGREFAAAVTLAGGDEHRDATRRSVATLQDLSVQGLRCSRTQSMISCLSATTMPPAW